MEVNHYGCIPGRRAARFAFAGLLMVLVAGLWLPQQAVAQVGSNQSYIYIYDVSAVSDQNSEGVDEDGYRSVATGGSESIELRAVIADADGSALMGEVVTFTTTPAPPATVIYTPIPGPGDGQTGSPLTCTTNVDGICGFTVTSTTPGSYETTATVSVGNDEQTLDALYPDDFLTLAYAFDGDAAPPSA